MVANGVAKDEPLSDSPTSVLADEDVCEEKDIAKLEEELLVDDDLAAEEQKLLEERLKEEEEEEKEEVVPELNDTGFTRLDDLLNQAQLFSAFLQEKMEDISDISTAKTEDEVEAPIEKKTARGKKRKATSDYGKRKAKKAVAAMLERSKENVSNEDSGLTELERVQKQQAELAPLLTGGTLKTYQIKGVKWLISLWQNGLNGILADQMGLGKTIQTIGFLSHLKGNGLHGPYLIIAPLSTLSNWLNEINRFTPSINAVIYHGSKTERDEIRRKQMPKTIGPNFPIVITSYEVAMMDAKRCLKQYHWKYLVVDEGHRLKNANCKLVKDLKLLKVDNRLLLTGTPLQNNLSELWSLLNFILPDIFSSHAEFEAWFDLSGKCGTEALREELEEKRRSQVVTKLHAILRPFLLRRLKVDVEHLLPRKKEIILYATMTEHQKNFADHLVNKTLESHLEEKGHIGGTRGKLHNLMVQLRKNCNHPDLLESAFNSSFDYPPVDEIVAQCGKFRLLDRLIRKLFAREHKVLIFSQWTKILDIIEYYFSEKGFEVCRIDGSVKLEERRRQIKEFDDKNSPCRIFLLSTRAGGLGINLTAADTCILYDSDWNPQMDLQAMDRCHRIGQTKPVHVYRLATAQSVEIRMLKRAFSKLKLEHIVIGKGQFQQEKAAPVTETMKEEELLALLRDEETEEEKWVQADISDDDLEKVLDRSDLINDSVSPAVSPKGPGWEVVATISGGMLSALNN